MKNSMNQSEEKMNLEEKDKAILTFALGRCYMLCQLLAQDRLGIFSKNDFKKMAIKLGAKVDGETMVHSVQQDNSS